MIKFIRRIFSSVGFWAAVNFGSLTMLISVKFATTYFSDPVSSDVFDVLFNLASGGAISFLFYFLVVVIPEGRRADLLKNNAIVVYKRIRQDIVTAVVLASVKGGRTDLSTSYDVIMMLIDVKIFREKFSSGKASNEGFYAFENQMSSMNYEFEHIVRQLKLLSAELNFFLLTYMPADFEHFKTLKHLELAVSSLLDVQPGYEESKPLCRFLYQFLAGFDWGAGYAEKDAYLEALEKI
jgi:hypothetical protein